ncbi:putative pumilio homolog 8, chloroplastic [Gastrolobium bilobum]|uniref:putative pumilio homolog 8, chloroplastic n=1 Tax=Gastrolobium bilobum TaxID=150636 RepID=UPI002AAF6DE3|nr:putative pumilio homolog 8, chloroplastic [Gastrolobium bilobum]
MRNEELRTWFNRIPNPNAPAPPYPNLHHGHVVSLTSQSYPSSPFSNGFRLHGDKSKSTMDDNDDEIYVRLSKEFSGMNILDEHAHAAKTRGSYDVLDSPYSYTYTPCSLDAHAPEETGTLSYQQHTPSSIFGPPMESSLNHGRSTCYGQIQLQKPPFASSYSGDRFLCSQRESFGMDRDTCWDVKSPFAFSQTMQPKVALNLNTPSSHYFSATKERAREAANDELSQRLSPRRTGGDPVAFKCDNSFIIQEKDIRCCANNRCNSLWGCKNNSHHEVAIQVVSDEVPKLISHVPASHVSNSTLASNSPQPMLHNFCSWADVQGYMCHLAKDQNGCRFLQRMVDEGTSKDVRIVFKGVIENVVELMMDPFGNYLVQKLLDVCREDQRLQIVLMLTKEPGLLVRTSLNLHGTRVVQKLIGTLNSRKQISLVRSAIQPGFLDLIKDLNGNHVIQRCLQCFSCEDNEFIFEAAAKFCVDIATHQHGCCVLQRCVDYAMVKYQDRLLKEICRHGLFLAQDPFGNYVVQYIIEMENPSASTKLISQFKGNYVNLSMQKFSSHVVEKCLKHVGESRSRIVRELLSVAHFEQLLQDPYANYVVQRALGVTKGTLHASLVEAVRPHKILRTSPYCKKIFSRNVLKK